jgi:hypothetical protein
MREEHQKLRLQVAATNQENQILRAQLESLSIQSTTGQPLVQPLGQRQVGPIAQVPQFMWSQPATSLEQQQFSWSPPSPPLDQQNDDWGNGQQQHGGQPPWSCFDKSSGAVGNQGLNQGSAQPRWRPPQETAPAGFQQQQQQQDAHSQKSHFEVEYESDDEEDNEEETNTKRKKKQGTFHPKLIRKEAEKIMLLPFPDVVSFRSWKTSVVHAVVQASARPDQNTVLNWLAEAFKTKSILDSLHEVPTSLLSIDGKLATALQQILNTVGGNAKALLHRVQMKLQEELQGHNRVLGGRQVLFMITKNCVTSDNQETFLGIEHLANLFMSNNDLEKFWNQWEQIVSQLPPNATWPKGMASRACTTDQGL